MTAQRRPVPPPKPEAPAIWSSAPAPDAPGVSVAWISRPRVGEAVAGDAVVVRRFGAALLVAVIDALGHGPKANEVARASTDWLEAIAPDAGGAADLMHGLHRQLRGSRGAAALLFLLSARQLEVCSVGNIELRSTTNKLPFVLTPGVLGARLRQPKACEVTPPLADRFVLYSDGISGRFDLKAMRALPAPELASHLFAAHRHTHDDSTVVVVDVADVA